jgi:hypothetical protein
MQIETDAGSIQYMYAAVAALACAVVAFKSYEYIRENLRARRDNPPPPDRDRGPDR